MGIRFLRLDRSGQRPAPAFLGHHPRLPGSGCDSSAVGLHGDLYSAGTPHRPGRETAIYCLCDTRPETAKTAVSDFSRYLRGNLDSLKKEGLISFSDELRHTQAYLSLEKLRYEEALEVAYDIKVSDFLLPPLTITDEEIEKGVAILADVLSK